MNLKSMMLGTAAAVIAVPSAYAADIAQPIVPVAVDYVKVCDTFSTGFFYIPGTDTCLRVGGRVRFRLSAGEGFGRTNDDGVQFRTDARVDFDARTMTEYGQLRSFFRIEGASSGRDVRVADAFIQLGYLTVGYATTQMNTSGIYGINDQTFYDFKTPTIAVLVDDIGGGFYAGASIQADADDSAQMQVNFDEDLLPVIIGRVGIEGQPWGGVELQGGYANDIASDPGSSMWFVRGVATIAAIDAFEVRLTAAYVDSEHFAFGSNDGWAVGLGGYFEASPSLGVYAGVVYDDGAYARVYSDPGIGDDRLFANIGVDYTVTPGLVLTGEVNYEDSDTVDDAFAGFLQLSRTF